MNCESSIVNCDVSRPAPVILQFHSHTFTDYEVPLYTV